MKTTPQSLPYHRRTIDASGDRSARGVLRHLHVAALTAGRNADVYPRRSQVTAT